MQEEQIAYTRINALTGDYLCIYVVDPESGRYREFSASDGFERFGLAKEGADFFAEAREQGGSFVFPEDVNRFLTAFTKENILAEIGNSGIFTLSYRLMMDEEPRYVQLKAAMVEEKEGPRLVVGINDIDAQVRQEETYVKNLARARIEASVDALTGVKNRHAFLMAEERINSQIAAQRALEFAVVVLDVNDLKRVNDTTGHEAGDQYLRAACKIICETFQHSPVFRIGGDEFAVISQGNDYAAIDELIARMRAHNLEAMETGGVTIACGMAKHAGEASMAPVFERADQSMYEDKSWLKAEKETKTGTRMAGIYEH
jgi:diguanylate cyclase (GGDEF)-like protein